MSDSDGFIAFLAKKHHIGEMERGLLFQNPSLPLFPVGASMPLDEIDLFEEDFLLLWKDPEHPAAFPLFLSMDYHDEVIFLNVIFRNDH